MFKLSIYQLLFIPASLAATLDYNWSIDFVTAAPDGFSRQVIGINGQWPCPTIEGSLGDTVTINITNNLGTQSTGLHFHGINQNGSPIMDGPSGVTQCPVPPGASFTYTFEVSLLNGVLRTLLILIQLNNPGTFWYHSHNDGQYGDGLRGNILSPSFSIPRTSAYAHSLKGHLSSTTQTTLMHLNTTKR